MVFLLHCFCARGWAARFQAHGGAVCRASPAACPEVSSFLAGCSGRSWRRLRSWRLVLPLSIADPTNKGGDVNNLEILGISQQATVRGKPKLYTGKETAPNVIAAMKTHFISPIDLGRSFWTFVKCHCLACLIKACRIEPGTETPTEISTVARHQGFGTFLSTPGMPGFWG
jgi:hypothetical protein